LKMKSGNLRFAHDDILLQTLGVKQGSVTPLGLFNDRKEKKVNLILDIRMMEMENQKLLFHPLSNEFTTLFTHTFLEAFHDHFICRHLVSGLFLVWLVVFDAQTHSFHLRVTHYIRV